MGKLPNAEKGASARSRPACGYAELSPQEFNRRKDLVVVLLKVGHAAPRFQGFRSLIPVSGSQEVPQLIKALPAGQPVGLVCADGDCSGRLAVRLSGMGYPVYHMAGGLVEWYHSFRGKDLQATG